MCTYVYMYMSPTHIHTMYIDTHTNTHISKSSHTTEKFMPRTCWCSSLSIERQYIYIFDWCCVYFSIVRIGLVVLCDMTHSHVGHDSFIYVTCGTWLIYICYFSIVRNGLVVLLEALLQRHRESAVTVQACLCDIESRCFCISVSLCL